MKISLDIKLLGFVKKTGETLLAGINYLIFEPNPIVEMPHRTPYERSLSQREESRKALMCSGVSANSAERESYRLHPTIYNP